MKGSQGKQKEFGMTSLEQNIGRKKISGIDKISQGRNTKGKQTKSKEIIGTHKRNQIP